MANGQIQDTRFYPFGEIRSGGTGGALDETGRGFTGHRENRDIGLTYMNARFYVSAAGRFASADTIVPDPMNPQSFNRYSYVTNNPVNLTDPSGHSGQRVLTPGRGGAVNSHVLLNDYDGRKALRIFAETGTFDGVRETPRTAYLATFAPGTETIDDGLTALTGCGFVCQSGGENPVGPGGRILSGIFFFGPGVGGNAARITKNFVQSLPRRLIKHGDELFGVGKVSKHVLDNAISNFNRYDFYASGEKLSLTKERLGHVLSRHHPEYFGAWTNVGRGHGQRAVNTAFDGTLSVNQVVDLAQETITSGFSSRVALPSGGYRYTTEVGGNWFTAVTVDNKIVQFHPLATAP